MIDSLEPFWLELPHGVRVRVRPLTPFIYEGALAAVKDTWAPMMNDMLTELEAGRWHVLSDPNTASAISLLTFAQTLAASAITEWEGVGDAAGAAVPASDMAAKELMLISPMAETFLALYLATAPEAVARAEQDRHRRARILWDRIRRDMPPSFRDLGASAPKPGG